MSLQQTVAAFVQALMSGGSGQGRGGPFANTMSQSIAYNSIRPDLGGAPDAGYSAMTATPAVRTKTFTSIARPASH